MSFFFIERSQPESIQNDKKTQNLGPLDVRDFFTCFGTALLEVYSNTVIIIVFLYRFRMASFVTGAVLTGVLRPALALMDTLQVCVRAFAHCIFIRRMDFCLLCVGLLGMYA